MSLTAGGVCNSIFPLLPSRQAPHCHEIGYRPPPFHVGRRFVRHYRRTNRWQGWVLVRIPSSSSGFLPPFAEIVLRSWPFLVASPVFLAVGSGLLYSLENNHIRYKNGWIPDPCGYRCRPRNAKCPGRCTVSPRKNVPTTKWCSSR